MKIEYRNLGVAAVLTTAALGLHLTRSINPTRVAEDLVQKLQRQDAAGIAQLFPAEELQAVGLSRTQAEQIVREVIFPRLGTMASNVTAVTRSGTPATPYAVLEKPRDDPRYFNPPMIVLAAPDLGEPRISLTSLLSSVWANLREDEALGLRGGNWRADRTADMKRVRELGMTGWMNWTYHRANPFPEAPGAIH